MKKLYTFILCLLALTYTGCKEDANEWPIEAEYDRPFRPTTFEIGEARPTSLKLSYTGVTHATNYIFEFGEVKLEGSDKLSGGLIQNYTGDTSHFFDQIVKTVDILADTLTTTSTATAEPAREYETWFDDLKGLTVYAIRMKAITKDGKESKYCELLMKTPPEQIFTSIVSGLEKATLFWEADKEVTHLRYGELNEEKTDTTWVAEVTLDASQKQAGQCIVQNLTMGTSYVAQIYNTDNLRGTMNFNTLGLKPSGTVGIIQATAGMNVNDEMIASIAAGQTDLMVIFNGGDLYDFEGKIQIPEGATSAYFIGDIEAGGVLPEVRAKELKVGSTLEHLAFQYIDLNGNKEAGFFMNLNGNPFGSISAEGCIIRNMNNCFLRLSGDLQGAEIKSIHLNNCDLIELSTSGWGVFNFNFSNGTVSELSITNCNVLDISDQLMDIRVKLDKITVDRNIFCQYKNTLPKIFLLGTEPAEIAVTNNIFCGDNKGAKIDSGYGDYKYFDYLSNYKTSDLVENKRPFTNATKLEITTEQLFIDPKNGDFHFNPKAKFPGDGTAGPSKWWTKK